MPILFVRFAQKFWTVFLLCIIFWIHPLLAQFLEDFEEPVLTLDIMALNGWNYFSGDGQIQMGFEPRPGYASIWVDATRDRRNVWWALIRRAVSENFDLARISSPDHELRIEARIRTSHAPRRVNLNLNTQRTTDFHSHLMEYDIPDTSQWHTISMTTRNFDALPGDTIYGQLALMDWGLERYRVDVDYFKVDIVRVDSVSPDRGEPIPYHPPVPSPLIFNHRVFVQQDVTIDANYPDVNFNNWSAGDRENAIPLLTVAEQQFILLRWDLQQFSGKKVQDSGLLELTTYSRQRLLSSPKDFGMIRIVEILGGDPDWQQEQVTFNNFYGNASFSQIFNPQMIIDVQVAEKPGNKNFIPISRPVLQRLIDGKTKGLAIHPLGAIQAAFFSLENSEAELVPKLHFNIKP